MVGRESVKYADKSNLKERVVEINGSSNNLADLLQMYLQKTDGIKRFGVDSINASTKPPTITFLSPKG